ncbi:MAG: GIY-YIG nuclease family protein [Patescibacteria group bacterium]
MYITYILQSQTNQKYYIGHTENLEQRLSRHNKGLVRSTKSGIPWRVIYIEKFNSKSEAYKRELQIKSYKGGEAFKKLI